MKRSRAEGDAAEPALVLPGAHALSLALAAQAPALAAALPDGVVACRLAAPGLVCLTLRAGAPSGLGGREWPLLVGGAGVGDDPAFAARFGGAARSPVAVRFGVPSSMLGVDDAGFPDATFWEGVGEAPSLGAVAARAVAWLRGPAADAPTRPAFLDAEAQTAAKLAVAERFRALAPCGALVAREPAALQAGWLAPGLRSLVAGGADAPAPAPAALLAAASVEWLAPGVAAFDLFSADFCGLLLGAVDGYEASELPKRRPNTMNRGGLILNDVGMEPLMSCLLRRLIAPLGYALFGDEPFASSLDHHHAFVVAYSKAEGGDRGLDMHHDASEVTLNVCLGRDGFAGGGLRFCGRFGAADHRADLCVAPHAAGRAILHLGRQRHGADELEAGERFNLIVWARSSAFRAAAAYGYIDPDGYPREAEAGAPDLLCLSEANDPDYAAQLKRIAAEAAAAGPAEAAAGGPAGAEAARPAEAAAAGPAEA